MGTGSNTDFSWNEYQDWVQTKVRRDHKYPNDSIACAAIGLAGETGEVCDMIKKNIFHDKGMDMGAFTKELGDCLFYIADLASKACIPLESVMRANVEKLNARYPKGFERSRAHSSGENPVEERPAGAIPHLGIPVDEGGMEKWQNSEND